MKQLVIILICLQAATASGQLVVQESFWIGTYIENDGEKLSHEEARSIFQPNLQALKYYNRGYKNKQEAGIYSVMGSLLVLGGVLTIGGKEPAIPLALSITGLGCTIASMVKASDQKKNWNRAVAIYKER